ncbi:MAG: GGDEF domain-containing protein [Candidatus Andeanibacterium colombiense]|uniref:diguanylate cyclase n=1 Tax=Candidatus Andeanibacterium colombiense TaxID=3121345 RepID=A0AAJ6BLN2_9SPHN|nr:MAG: GGDEF domain-containing protein [Sphingomonadaceae bacterium]
MGRFNRLFAWFALLVGLCAAAPAAATAIAPACHAFSGDATAYAELSARPVAWDCGPTHWKDSRPVGWLRFEAKDWRGRMTPVNFVTRITKFDRVTVLLIAGNGAIRSFEYHPDDAVPRAGRSVFSLGLPPIPEDTAQIAVRFERAWNAAVLSDARLSDDPDGGAWPVALLAGMGMLIGLLFAPVIFDLATFSVLRQRFVLWHGALVLAMLVYVLSFSGMISVFLDLRIETIAALNGLAPAVAVAAAGFFVVDFLEPGALSRRMRNAVMVASLVALAVPGTITVHPPFLDYTSHQFYFLGFVPALAVHAAALAQAYRRRSRSVKFLIAAWTPLLLMGAERIVRGLGLYGAPPMVDELLYLGLVVEVVISALGVADRMLSLRDQRDVARGQARILGDLAEHDPLTGLLNRRAIEPRFGELCNAGFNTFALIDLDDFKAINDRHGHAVGDEVLRAVAVGLAPDPDTLAMRLGGEEFLLLLRGSDGKNRAEQRRQSLARHIAARVPGLDRIVTASMGLIEGPPETMAASEFREVYARADKLLYEAKLAGRNRMFGEKLTLFAIPKGERRGGDRRKGNRRRET